MAWQGLAVQLVQGRQTGIPWERHSLEWRSAGHQSGDWRSRISGCACPAVLSLASLLLPRPFRGQRRPDST
jgi:hypothetical protein